MERREAEKALVSLLQRAHAGELAAALAYRGHWRSLPPGADREAIRRIEREELDHRRGVGEMLSAMGARPSRRREAVFRLVGRIVGALCHVTGWFAPMYGAGRLESGNIVEYEVAARLALASGWGGLAGALSRMADVEAEHERFFREKVLSHWLSRVLPLWSVPVPVPASATTAETAPPG